MLAYENKSTCVTRELDIIAKSIEKSKNIKRNIVRDLCICQACICQIHGWIYYYQQGRRIEGRRWRCDLFEQKGTSKRREGVQQKAKRDFTYIYRIPKEEKGRTTAGIDRVSKRLNSHPHKPFFERIRRMAMEKRERCTSQSAHNRHTPEINMIQTSMV